MPSSVSPDPVTVARVLARLDTRLIALLASLGPLEHV